MDSYGDGNVYRGVRSKDSETPTYVCKQTELNTLVRLICDQGGLIALLREQLAEARELLEDSFLGCTYDWEERRDKLLEALAGKESE